MTENILDLGGQIVASWKDRGTGGETINFYNYDIRGSVTGIVNPDGNAVKQYSYNEFGNISQTGTFENEVTFTGSVTDTSTGLQYMNARFYNPTTGRFLSQDSYTGNVYEPWTQHLYSYCGNNPTNFTDPTGHMADPFGAGSGRPRAYTAKEEVERLRKEKRWIRQQAPKKSTPTESKGGTNSQSLGSGDEIGCTFSTVGTTTNKINILSEGFLGTLKVENETSYVSTYEKEGSIYSCDTYIEKVDNHKPTYGYATSSYGVFETDFSF